MNVLTPNEVAITQMALAQIVDDLKVTSRDPKIPFTPEARKDMKDMILSAESAHKKIAMASGKMLKLDPFNEGDEKEFLTKES